MWTLFLLFLFFFWKSVRLWSIGEFYFVGGEFFFFLQTSSVLLCTNTESLNCSELMSFRCLALPPAKILSDVGKDCLTLNEKFSLEQRVWYLSWNIFCLCLVISSSTSNFPTSSTSFLDSLPCPASLSHQQLFPESQGSGRDGVGKQEQVAKVTSCHTNTC